MISIVNTECHVPKTFSDLAKIAAWGRLGREGKGEGAKGYWIEIGSAWTNADGSLSLAFDAVPVNGRAVLRQRTEKATEGAAQDD